MLKIIKEIINKEDISKQEEADRFIDAIISDDKRTVDHFVTTGFPLKQKGQDGYSPLSIMLHCSSEFLPYVASRSSPTFGDTYHPGTWSGGEHSIQSAAYDRLMTTLVEAGADVNISNVNGYSPLSYASSRSPKGLDECDFSGPPRRDTYWQTRSSPDT